MATFDDEFRGGGQRQPGIPRWNGFKFTECGSYVLGSDAEGVVNATGLLEQGAEGRAITRTVAGDGGAQGGGGCPAGGCQAVKRRKRDLSVGEVQTQCLPNLPGIPNDVQNVIDDLERNACLHAEGMHGPDERRICAGVIGTEFTRDGRKCTRFAADDIEVLRLRNPIVAA